MQLLVYVLNLAILTKIRAMLINAAGNQKNMPCLEVLVTEGGERRRQEYVTWSGTMNIEHE